MDERKKSFRQALQDMNCTKFIQLFEDNGFSTYLDQHDNQQYTLLVPPDHTMDESLIAKNELKDWLMYHVLDKPYAEKELVDNQLLMTEAGETFLGKGAKQRLRVQVTNQDQLVIGPTKKSIQFGNTQTASAPEYVDKQGYVYPVDEALQLPGDLMHQLPTHLDLSTFVASMFASKTIDMIQLQRGITLFAPTNAAFERLGLVTKYFLHPKHKSELAHLLRFHTVHGVYYQDSWTDGEQSLPTMSQRHGQIDQLHINKTVDGSIYVRGHGALDGNDASVIARVVARETLMRNGVMHRIDRVQMPKSLIFTHKDILAASGCCNGFLDVMEKAGLMPLLDRPTASLDAKAYTVLAPNDRAFAKLNLTRLLQDTSLLERVARLHMIPAAMPATRLPAPSDGHHHKKKKEADKKHDSLVLPTMHDEHSVVLKRADDAEYYDEVHVQGFSQDRADVVTTGRVTNGGGVLVIDQVLLPEQDFDHGLPWWQVLLIAALVLMFFAILGAVAYYIWKRWQAYRDGYARIEDQPNPDTVDEEANHEPQQRQPPQDSDDDNIA
ncbi:FAS1 domain-containing protein [Hesseltinella vesiculosa]|uniref:FAS1 domain-containing protein n=1 Tax=Hesseltinella vesiculosa TaxID=101127 RepID=A0A1X2GXN6_9FUNG|nr:FAS1 domain-containing protein [Hesseltinella vesiculosa]